MNVFKLLKIFVIKVTYGFLIVRFFISVKKSLKESAALSNNKEREKSHRNLLHFILIPLFLNLLFLCHDIPKAVFSFIEPDCESNREEIFGGICACVFTVGSFSYFVGYITFFPKIREALFTCGKVVNG